MRFIFATVEQTREESEGKDSSKLAFHADSEARTRPEVKTKRRPSPLLLAGRIRVA